MKYITGLLLSLLFCVNAVADDCSLEVRVGDNLTFTPATMSVSKSQCSSVTINLVHTGNLPKQSMGHNWVLSATEDAQNVAQAGWSAGLNNQYLPKDDTRIIAATDIIGGGERTSISFSTDRLKAGGDYTFFCSFVGHFAVMKGKFTVTD